VVAEAGGANELIPTRAVKDTMRLTRTRHRALGP
jgi:hypothetical protein